MAINPRVEKNIEFSVLMDSLSLGVCRFALKPRQTFVFVNRTFCRMLGYEREELLRLPVGDIFISRNDSRELIKKLCEHENISHKEARLKTRAGAQIMCSLSMVAVKDEKDKIAAVDMVIQDISGQRRTEEELRESKELFQTVFNNSPVAILVTDKSEQIIAWNSFSEKMFGMDKQDLFNKPVKDLYPPKQWQRMRALRIRKKGLLSDIETQMYRQDGSLLDVNLSISIIKNKEGEIEGAIGIMSDISEKRRVQEELVKAKTAAEAANSSKSLFLANMSHEVRTPMNTILGMVDLTLDTKLTDEQRDNLQTVKNAADVLLTLLNDILDLSRVEAGKIQMEKIEINVRDILNSVGKSMALVARNKGLKLLWSVQEDVPKLVIGDPTRIRQVLVNLINNAMKFTFKGEIEAQVKLKRRDKDRCELLFSVRDSGVGIPKDKQAAIFEVFTQADVSTTRRFGGTGLGLAISRKLVEMHGGKIWVESEEFKGSTFYFQIPFTVVKKEDVPQALKAESIEDQLRAQLPNAPAESKRDLKQLSVLLAEDNIVNQRMTMRMLEKRGWQVTSVDNGQQVLDYLHKGAFDIILMDVQMPILDGFEATRIIRENEKNTGLHIPIVALTARAMSGDEEKCKACGMDGYVSKPIDRQKLYEAIEKFF